MERCQSSLLRVCSTVHCRLGEPHPGPRSPCVQLAAAAVPGSGRGLVASQAIGKGEALLHIPQQLLLTPAVAQQRSSLLGLLEGRPLPAWSVLALWLAEARAAGSAGVWWPYLQLLPQRTGCVLEWTPEEVEWLRGSQLHVAATDIRAAAEASWQEMQPLLGPAEQLGLGSPGAFSRGALQWAFAILLSRLVRLSGLPGQEQQQLGQGGATWDSAAAAAGAAAAEIEVLLPFADLLNHCPTATCFLEWSAAEGAVVLRTDRRGKAVDSRAQRWCKAQPARGCGEGAVGLGQAAPCWRLAGPPCLVTLHPLYSAPVAATASVRSPAATPTMAASCVCS